MKEGRGGRREGEGSRRGGKARGRGGGGGGKREEEGEGGGRRGGGRRGGRRGRGGEEHSHYLRLLSSPLSFPSHPRGHPTHSGLTTSTRPTKGRDSHSSQHHQTCASGDHYADHPRSRQGKSGTGQVTGAVGIRWQIRIPPDTSAAQSSFAPTGLGDRIDYRTHG